MGVSDPEVQKKVFGPRWRHEVEKQNWSAWKRFMHRLQHCPICESGSNESKIAPQDRKAS